MVVRDVPGSWCLGAQLTQVMLVISATELASSWLGRTFIHDGALQLYCGDTLYQRRLAIAILTNQDLPLCRAEELQTLTYPKAWMGKHTNCKSPPPRHHATAATTATVTATTTTSTMEYAGRPGGSAPCVPVYTGQPYIE